MLEESSAFKELWGNIYDHKQSYSAKMEGVYKTIIAVSSGMLSVVAALAPTTDQQHIVQGRLFLQGSLLLFLLSVIFASVSLYGSARVHMVAVNNILAQIKASGSAAEAKKNLSYKSSFPHPIYRASNYTCCITFLLSLVSLTCYAVLNV